MLTQFKETVAFIPCNQQKKFTMRARPQFLVFVFLLLAIITQNGQTHPAGKKHAAKHVQKKHSAAPAHKTHAAAFPNKRHTAVAAHKRHSAVRDDRRHTAVSLHNRQARTADAKRPSYRTMQPPRIMPDTLRRTLINSENNRLTNPGQLARLKEKLQRDVLSRKKVVRIVHIGDSHVQADMMTRVLRLGLQYRYGNAGRGIVFPLQLAKTNAPADIFSSSNQAWLYGHLSMENSPVKCGVCGYGLQGDAANWELEIGSMPERGDEDTFDMVRLFTGKNSGCINISYNGTEKKEVCMEPGNSFDTAEVTLSMKTNTISLSGKSPDFTAFTFYGISFEKNKASGVLYHSIGVNGAEFASYNSDPLFFEQIGALKADCYIISLGTNEAQKRKLNSEDFALQIRSMVMNLRRISPDAVFIITTPAPSLLHGVAINPKIKTVTEVLAKVSDEEKISLWNYYDIIGGNKGLAMLQTYGLYRPDFIHFNRTGYELQGFMLLSALLKCTL